MIRSSRWLPWSSLGTLKLVFNVPSDDQGSRPDDLSISLCVPDNGRWRRCHMSLVHTWSRPPLYSSHGDTSCHPTPDNTACSVHHSLNLQDITKVHSIYNFFSLKTSISFMKMLILKYLPFCSGLNVWTLPSSGPLHICDPKQLYRKTSSIIRTLVGNKIVDNSDVVGASPVGAVPTTSSFST